MDELFQIATPKKDLGATIDDWPTYETGDCEGWQWPGNDIGLGCQWRFNMPHGKHQIFLEIDPPERPGVRIRPKILRNSLNF